LPKSVSRQGVVLGFHFSDGDILVLVKMTLKTD